MGPVYNDAYRFSPAAPHEEHVFGAACPGWHSAGSHETTVNRWVEFMLDHGIDRVLSLLPVSRSDADDTALARYHDAFGQSNVRHVPVPNRRLVGADILRDDILPFLVDTTERGDRVVVHCLAGLGRTGQVLAAWLVSYHEYPPHEAVDTVMRMGRDPTEIVDRGDATRHELLTTLGKVA
ncbi:MAG: dual specificity protein phosphatase family protein [Haloarculaceae archaeon]